MNETMAILKNRRSTRIFRTDQIGKDELSQIMEAGLYAPSGNNQQGWHFSVVQDKDTLDALSDSAKRAALKSDNEFLRQYAKSETLHAFYHAPTAIIVSGDKAAMTPELDCAAATENMLIAAESLGFATCWVALVAQAFQGDDAKQNREKIGVPDNYTPYYAIALGYRKGEKEKAPPRKANAVTFA